MAKKDRVTPNLNVENFKTISSHVAYELDMLNECVSRYTTLFPIYPDQTHFHKNDEPKEIREIDDYLHDLLIEGVALHSRGLITFLFYDPRDDDVNAICFFDEPKPSKWTPKEKPPFLDDVVTWANKRLAHMTTERLKPNPSFSFYNVSQVLTFLLYEFSISAPQDRISDDLKNVLARPIIRTSEN